MLSYRPIILSGILALGMAGAAAAQGVDLRPENNESFRSQERMQEKRDWRDSVRDGVRNEIRGETRISQREAVRIAQRQGIEDVDRVRLSRGAYVIDGSDRRGDDIVVRVSASGEVLDVRRD